MPINPSEISTKSVSELSPGAITTESLIPLENDGQLERITGQDLVDFINVNASAKSFRIEDAWVSQEYIDINFDDTGLGREIELGYAICNGNNGTPNLDGLVSIGYGENYNVIKAVGGSKDAILVAHTHNVVISGGAGGDGYATLNDGVGTGRTYTTDSAGVSGVNKNMQPYMVLLKIMKL